MRKLLLIVVLTVVVATGIPLAQSTWDEIAALAAELGVSMDGEAQSD